MTNPKLLKTVKVQDDTDMNVFTITKLQDIKHLIDSLFDANEFLRLLASAALLVGWRIRIEHQETFIERDNSARVVHGSFTELRSRLYCALNASPMRLPCLGPKFQGESNCTESGRSGVHFVLEGTNGQSPESFKIQLHSDLLSRTAFYNYEEILTVGGPERMNCDVAICYDKLSTFKLILSNFCDLIPSKLFLKEQFMDSLIERGCISGESSLVACRIPGKKNKMNDPVANMQDEVEQRLQFDEFCWKLSRNHISDRVVNGLGSELMNCKRAPFYFLISLSVDNPSDNSGIELCDDDAITAKKDVDEERLHEFLAYEDNLFVEEAPDGQMLKIKKALEEKHKKLISIEYDRLDTSRVCMGKTHFISPIVLLPLLLRKEYRENHCKDSYLFQRCKDCGSMCSGLMEKKRKWVGQQ